MRNQKWLKILILTLGIGGAPVLADEKTDLLEEKIRQLEARISEQKAVLEAQIAAQQAALESLKQELRAPAGTVKTGTPAVVKAEPAAVSKEVAEEMKKNGWAGIKISGDIRLRGETSFYDGPTPERTRLRLRTRLGFSKSMGRGVTGIVRLATGTAKTVSGFDFGPEPNSTNQTLGDSFDGKGIWLDQAYLTWTPELPGKFLTFGGGKFANPFVTSIAVWDSDVNPEGFYQRIAVQEGFCQPFLTMGQTVLRENATSRDAYMLGWQGGLLLKGKESAFTMAAAYYDYANYAANFKYAAGNTTDVVNTKTVLDAGDFDIVNVSGKFEYGGWRQPVEVFADFSRNTGDEATGSHAGQDTAWSVGGTVGQNKKQRDWSFFYRYARIEANAVVGVMSDSDFGYSNQQGSHLSLKYNIFEKLTLAGTLLANRKIIGGEAMRRVQIDFEYKF